ncbi:MAG: transcription-repair coupling factor [gamma proteobacterium symbiont of Bathyaustriella thionipta]|nr:transcription-repair coupling factor [gamma proteobacterium symbiont of Bathyaustriella thionipta]MCU7951307.1 transcription-repair coupling factor [gamma proteobacterium symbiont of Bathyaustriella thionipta]MCU7953803.1 transcription-repair coupling factor [gamma proteobacterium symbiont of Bathyaustriella thionipta]MCU7957859.1 transcription-repair coupling factor [gamma proteobacterium symbiont of Bathyaustriella thionipta]MCU7966520.1 transcription-repair coupling factor [gamma proteoba
MDKLYSPLYPEFVNKPGMKSHWGKLYGSALTLAISNLTQQSDQFITLITSDMPSSQKLKDVLSFFLAESALDILTLPDWETLPYDQFSPHQDIISERLATLYRLPQLKQGILIVPLNTLMHRLMPLDYINNNTLLLDKGMTLDIAQFRRDLEKRGYRCVANVYEHGEFAVRGSIIDLYPMGSSLPYRIDLFDDEIDSIKTFDIETQRSINTIDSINMMPAREFPLDKQTIELFREQYRNTLGGELTDSIIYNEVGQGISPAGIEYYLPLFYEQTTTLFDFLPEQTIILNFTDLETVTDQFINDTEQRYEQYQHNITRPILEPAQLFLRTDEIFAELKKYPRIICQNFEFQEKAGVYNYSSEKPPSLTISTQTATQIETAFNQLLEYLQAAKSENRRILFCAETAGRRETLLELFKPYKIYPKKFSSWNDFRHSEKALGICIAPLNEGLQLANIALISESQLYGQQVMQRRRRKNKSQENDAIINTLAELKVGAPVVHEDNGVGRYLGLETITLGNEITEFLALEYAGGDKLYVPVAALHLISRYTGSNPDTAPLHKLGSGQWEKAKRKAREKIRDVAAELLEIYAQREAQQGFVYRFDEQQYHAFASGFGFEETPDQQKAIENVIEDMSGPKPMDRLVCGDVGFGKTEVAMRAAFLAISGGKQVAILVPTTLLSQQHTENFQTRFAEWPIKIAGLSRFQSKKEQELILKGVANGTVDVVIGTHKLLQESIKYKELGLVIIDEEHRFGVRQKERFKQLRSKVDILTLTATPIPRTLNMSLSGIRDFSIIATPPARRLSIKTFVQQWNNDTIKEACQREIMRGGQIFVLHNNVQTIEKKARELAELIPEARVDIAHGQMREHNLEQIMSDFYHQRFNILVCTTIIETGIDIPTANTIIIERADRFGLAQLYQLRGRVGRSHHKAYAYLTIPRKKLMTSDAIKRLEAIEAIEDLGAGFTLATHDLEIRGSGELLGEDQSGQIHEIGFTLYTDLLERAVKSLKEGKDPELETASHHGTEIEMHIPALIPDDYLPDIHTRLVMYKRIANARDDMALKDIQVEMIDRFGLLTDQIKNLFAVTSLKLKATPLDILSIDYSENGGRIIFSDKPDIDPMKIINLIQTKSVLYKLDGNSKLKLLKKESDITKQFQYLSELLDHLGS